MKLTRTERWILANQYKILEALYPDDEAYYKEARTALENGYELHYGWIAQNIFERTLSEDECREIGEILSMFAALQDSYNALPDNSGVDEWKCNFLGFDGNHETAQLLYAQFYCNSGGGRFGGLDRPHDFNSHAPMLDRYRRMLRAWKRGGEKYSLNKEQILGIISEQG